jgi:hypothetical protein
MGTTRASRKRKATLIIRENIQQEREQGGSKRGGRGGRASRGGRGGRGGRGAKV